MKARVVAGLMLLLAGASHAQAPSFTGTWKLNLAKSQLTGQTVTIEQKPGGLFRFDMQGYAFDFSADGKEHPMPDGETTAWRQVSPTLWESTNRVKGQVVSTYRSEIKGNTLSVMMRVVTPGAPPLETASTWTRMSGGPGLAGRWKSTEIKGAAPTLELSVQDDRVTVKYPEAQVACIGRFDGKDHVVTIAEAAVKQTVAFERQSASAIKMTTKIDGKPLYVDVLTLSADGRTLTQETRPTEADEPSKAVYERQ